MRHCFQVYCTFEKNDIRIEFLKEIYQTFLHFCDFFEDLIKDEEFKGIFQRKTSSSTSKEEL